MWICTGLACRAAPCSPFGVFCSSLPGIRVVFRMWMSCLIVWISPSSTGPSTNRCLCRFSVTVRTVITLISHFLIGPSGVVYDYCTGQSLTFIPGKSSSEKSSGVLRKEVGKRRSLLHIGKETQMLVPLFVQNYLTATTRRCGVRRLCVRIGKRKQGLV